MEHFPLYYRYFWLFFRFSIQIPSAIALIINANSTIFHIEMDSILFLNYSIQYFVHPSRWYRKPSERKELLNMQALG